MKISETEIHLIPDSSTVRNSLERINNFPSHHPLVLFLINKDGHILGSLTDGDIRRGLLNNIQLQDQVKQVANRNYRFLTKNSSVKDIKSLREDDLKIVPVLDENSKFINLVNFKTTKTILPLDVVVMAGGKGTRLHPYTKDMPKPLLELENKPIIAHNIDRLISFGVRNFHVSINHMKDQIINFLENYYKNKDIVIKYLEENSPLGTIGSVALAENYENDDILVINADILTNIDFEDFYITHKDSSSDMSVAAFNVKIDVPYAVLETKEDRILSFVEKPSYLYHSNAGIYIFNKSFVKNIPVNQHYDAIDLMSSLIKSEKRVSHFPIRGYWLDIGNLQNYKKAQEDIRHIRF